MIISRTPFRLSFAGGGSDLPDFYQNEEGAVLSTALNKYMYITVNKRFDHTVRLGYAKTEIVEAVDQIHHPIFKYVLKKYIPDGGVELISMADIPSGTGLGSSSSFTVGLLHALKKYLRQNVELEDLAREACEIEIEKLHEPIGKQDQYIAAYGGLKFIQFMPSGQTKVTPVNCNDETKRKLEACCLLFYTGQTRDAKDVLQEQKKNTVGKRQDIGQMVTLAKKMKGLLEENKDLETFGKLLHDAWMVKKSLATNISSSQVDQYYEAALEAGAWGGKILGAGGGGFLMLFCDPNRKEKVMATLSGLRNLHIQFDPHGSQIIFKE